MLGHPITLVQWSIRMVQPHIKADSEKARSSVLEAVGPILARGVIPTLVDW